MVRRPLLLRRAQRRRRPGLFPVSAHFDANPGLNDDLGYTYKSQVNNAEINQRFKINNYNPWWNWSWLWGVRYFRLSDNLNLYGSDTDFDNSENLNYKTANNLLVGQAGLTWTRGWQRFQFTTEGKIGPGRQLSTRRKASMPSEA